MAAASPTDPNFKPRARRGSTPWTEVLAMTGLQVSDSTEPEDDGAVFDPEAPRDMSRCAGHLRQL